MSKVSTFPAPAFRLLPRSRLTVSAILREPPEAVLRFVAWYLTQDADRIVLCFEDPDDPSIEMLDGVERVECIRCTPDFWQQLGLDSNARFTLRQNHAMAYVYRSVAAGWFLNVDCDELVHLDGRTLAEEVERQPDEFRAIRIAPVERLRTPGHEGQVFRRLMLPMAQHRAYGDTRAGIALKFGLTGHYLGKSVTRSGQSDLTMRQHWMLTPQGDIVTDRVLDGRDGAYLLHLNDPEFREWCGKLPVRMSNRWFPAPVRDIILEVLATPEPEPALKRLYAIFYEFDAKRLERLAWAGARYDLDLDPDEIAVSYFRGRAA